MPCCQDNLDELYPTGTMPCNGNCSHKTSHFGGAYETDLKTGIEEEKFEPYICININNGDNCVTAAAVKDHEQSEAKAKAEAKALRALEKKIEKTGKKSRKSKKKN
jgi:hypothetical protein